VSQTQECLQICTTRASSSAKENLEVGKVFFFFFFFFFCFWFFFQFSAVVYACVPKYDPSLELAVKVLSLKSEQVKDLNNEVRLLQSVRSPNIVQLVSLCFFFVCLCFGHSG
jgi:hypothetical protein